MLMYLKLHIFQGKLFYTFIFPRNKQPFSRFNSSCVNIPDVVDLIAKQYWSELKTHLKSTNPIALLHQLLTSGADSDLTLRYFTWSQKELKLSHSLELTFRMLHSLAYAKKYSKIRSFLDNCVQNDKNYPVSFIFHAISVSGDSFCANSIIVDILVWADAKNLKTRLGFEAFKRASDYGLKLSVTSCNPLMSGLVKMYKADAILKEMKADGICPNEVTFNILIDGFCNDKNVSVAMKVFAEMNRQGVKPNVVTYNSLINGLCNNGKVNEATTLRDQMVNSCLEPNIITHNALLNGFCKNKMVKQAGELFEDMPKQRITPNVTTYNILIDAYCKDENMEDAFALYRIMLGKGVYPDVSTYNCLIVGLCRKGDLEGARNRVSEMDTKHLKADLITYNILMDSLCNKGEMKKTLRLLDEMCKKGLKPSQLTYNTMIDGYSKEGNLRQH
ncbi:pentatricopeptide repeat-containing protein, putative [Ricinus communis]|uniref:Pentatricopeptide repeat-containing protein, putative n=1 Tax=Ricinus communis TaxID=3988 RepID=B9RFI9_RICCO|nr:pentatricopeptide repeat-containing protein, putative [Ricinus communis]